MMSTVVLLLACLSSIVRAGAAPPRISEKTACTLVEQTSRAPCTLGVSFGCDAQSRTMWVANCRGSFQCGGPKSAVIPCGYPPGHDDNCTCVPPRSRRPFTLHIHVSGSGGTSVCEMARANQERVPFYNCEMPGKEHESWRELTKSNRRQESGDTGSCHGLRRTVANGGGGGFAFTFGAAESPAPHWMGCSGVRYTFLMVEPVKRVLTAAYGACVSRRPNCTGAGTCWWIPPTCDAAAYLRASYARQWAIDPDPPQFPRGMYWETPRINEWNLRTLLSGKTLLAPLGALDRNDLERTKQRLSTFAFAAALPTRHKSDISKIIRAALGWKGALPNAQFGVHQQTKSVAHNAVAATPPDVLALVQAHNPLDIALYEWLMARQRDTAMHKR